MFIDQYNTAGNIEAFVLRILGEDREGCFNSVFIFLLLYDRNIYICDVLIKMASGWKTNCIMSLLWN